MSLTATDAERAPWWSELLAIKDETTFADLAARFGVTVYAIRKALERTGESKLAMPRGPKPAGARATAAEPLALAREKLGTMPDAELATMAGVPVEAIRGERKKRGITRFRRQQEGAEVQVEAPAPPSAPLSTPPGPPVPGAVDPLDAYAHQLGKVADQVVADAAGVSRQQVGLYRRKHDIPAYDGFRVRGGAHGGTVASTAPEAAVAHADPTPSPAVQAPRAAPAPVPVAPAPTPVPATAPAQPAPRQGYTVSVVRGDGAERRFCVMGATLADAVSRAELLLARRDDGAWTVRAVTFVADALE